MCRINRFFLTALQSILLFNSTKQSAAKLATTTFKVIGKAMKSPMFKTIGNTMKKPIVTRLGNTMKKSVSLFSRNKITVKSIASGLQNKSMKVVQNFGSKTVKKLGQEGIKNFKYAAPQVSKRGSQFARTQSTKNSQMKSASAQVQKTELGSLFNMVSKSKPMLPFLFAAGGFSRLAQANLVPMEGENMKTEQNNAMGGMALDSIKVEAKAADPSAVAPNAVDPNAAPAQAGDTDNVAGGLEKGITLDLNEELKNIEAKPLMEPEPKKEQAPEGTVVGNAPRLHPALHQDAQPTAEILQPSYAELTESGQAEMKEIVNKLVVKIRFSNGSKYEGETVDGKPVGQGKLRFMNGVEYTGTFAEGKFHGKGLQKMMNNNVYEGHFLFGKMTGRGSYTQANGTIYNGEFLDGKKHGKGILTEKKGTLYKGKFLHDSKNGYGEQFFNDGDSYKGYFRDDIFSGEGIMHVSKTDITTSGLWRNGQPIPEGGKPIGKDGLPIKRATQMLDDEGNLMENEDGLLVDTEGNPMKNQNPTGYVKVGEEEFNEEYDEREREYGHQRRHMQRY